MCMAGRSARHPPSSSSSWLDTHAWDLYTYIYRDVHTQCDTTTQIGVVAHTQHGTQQKRPLQAAPQAEGQHVHSSTARRMPMHALIAARRDRNDVQRATKAALAGAGQVGQVCTLQSRGAAGNPKIADTHAPGPSRARLHHSRGTHARSQHDAAAAGHILKGVHQPKRGSMEKQMPTLQGNPGYGRAGPGEPPAICSCRPTQPRPAPRHSPSSRCGREAAVYSGTRRSVSYLRRTRSVPGGGVRWGGGGGVDARW